MAEVMMQLGFFRFSVGTAAYQELSRVTEYRWAAQPRIGKADALQFTGLGPERIDLSGAIYPHYRGGLAQLDKMRTQALLGLPLILVSGVGRILGLWVIEAVTEGQRAFAKSGAPLRQEFEIRLRRYDGGLRALLPI